MKGVRHLFLVLNLFPLLSWSYVDETIYPAGYYPPANGERIITGTYITGAAGYTSIDWQYFPQSPFLTYSNNSAGGITYGFAVGYRFFDFFALEGGWYSLPTVQGFGLTTQFNPPLYTNIGISNWFGYLWGKFLIHITHTLYLDLSLGFAYRAFQLIPQYYFTNPNPYYYSLLGGVGLQYDITQNTLLFFKYFFIPSNPGFSVQARNGIAAPAVNSFVLGVGYKFSI